MGFRAPPYFLHPACRIPSASTVADCLSAIRSGLRHFLESLPLLLDCRYKHLIRASGTIVASLYERRSQRIAACRSHSASTDRRYKHLIRPKYTKSLRFNSLQKKLHHMITFRIPASIRHLAVHRCFSIAAAMGMLICRTVLGAPIAWDAPQNISGAADVSAEGAYYGSWSPGTAPLRRHGQRGDDQRQRSGDHQQRLRRLRRVFWHAHDGRCHLQRAVAVWNVVEWHQRQLHPQRHRPPIVHPGPAVFGPNLGQRCPGRGYRPHADGRRIGHAFLPDRLRHGAVCHRSFHRRCRLTGDQPHRQLQCAGEPGAGARHHAAGVHDPP